MWKQRQGGKGDEESGNDSWRNLCISGDILSDCIGNCMDLNIGEEDINMHEDTMVTIRNKNIMDMLLKQIGKVALLVMVVGIGFVAVKYHATKEADMTTIIRDALDPIGEFATYEYTYHGEAKIEDSRQLGNVKIPFTKHSITIPYDGAIKVGYQISDIDIQVKGKEICVHLPEPKILDNYLEIDYEKIESDNNILNPIEPNELGDWKENEKEERLKNAEEMGIYDSAETSAREQIRALLEYIDGYHVDFR